MILNEGGADVERVMGRSKAKTRIRLDYSLQLLQPD